MEYQELVAEARPLVKRRKEDRDRLIVLTMEALSKPEITHQRWADDIGVHLRTVTDWVRFAKETQQGGRPYDDWYQETRRDESDRAASSTQNLPAEQKAEVVRQWLADDDGGRTRAEVGRVLHQHDSDTEQHLADTRQARANEGQRPDFDTTESVQRVLADIAELEIDAAKLPEILSDRSKSLLSYSFRRIKATVDYYADIEHEHGLTDEEIARQFFGGQS